MSEHRYSEVAADTTTQARVVTAIHKLALLEGRPYMVGDSFLQDEDAVIDLNTRLGIISEIGNETSGTIKAVWLDDDGMSFIEHHTGQAEAPQGYVSFARQTEDAYLHGVIGFYGNRRGGDTKVGAFGRVTGETYEDYLGMLPFANRVGIGTVWSKMYASGATTTEQRYQQRADKATAIAIYTALLGEIALFT